MSLLVKQFVVNPQAIGALKNLDLTSQEEQKLAETITLIYHQKLLNRFLEILSEEDKKLFLEVYLGEDQEKSVKFLQEKIANIEDVVARAISEIEERIFEDINELKGT